MSKKIKRQIESESIQQNIYFKSKVSFKNVKIFGPIDPNQNSFFFDDAI